MRKAFLSALLLTAAALAFVSCDSLVLPPGMSRVGDVLQNKTSTAASPNAVYALLTWYNEEYQDRELPRHWQSYVDNNRASALSDINSQWRDTLVAKSQGLIAQDPTSFMELKPEAIADRTDWNELQRLIHDLRTLLTPPHVLPVPLEECLVDHFWKSRSAMARESFCAWAQGRNIVIPPPETLKLHPLRQQLEAIEKALLLKKKLCQAMEDAKGLCDEAKYLDALNVLTELQPQLKLDSQCLTPLEDNTTLKKLDDLIAHIPHQALDAALKDLSDALDSFTQTSMTARDKSATACDEAFQKLETQATSRFFAFVADQRFKAAWAEKQPRIKETIGRFADSRARIWIQLADEDLAEKHFWDAVSPYRFHAEILAMEHHTQFGLYALTPSDGHAKISDDILRNVRGHLLALLPNILNELLEIAEKTQKIDEKPGCALALCIMAEEMTAILGADSADKLQKPLETCRKLKAELVEKLENTFLRRTIAVTDMTSAMPGLGLTCTLDTKHQLEKFLKSAGMDKYLALSGNMAATSPYGYMLYDGVVADFNGKETIERHNTRKIRSVGQIRKAPNPELQANPAAPPEIYTQEVSEQLINMREIERIAHIRLLASLRGPGFTTQVEVNEFYSKCFIIEESHPFNDIRVVDVLKTYDMAKLPFPDDAPTLRYDRIWTAGEMLDWARKDAIQVFALKLFFHIAQFPFLLENTARQYETDGNLAAATEQWALCYLTASDTSLDNNGVNVTSDATHPMAKCYEECIDNLRKQRAAFMELKKHCRENLIDAAARFLKANAKQ